MQLENIQAQSQANAQSSQAAAAAEIQKQQGIAESKVQIAQAQNQFDIAKLENEPAARSKLVDILQEANPTEDRNVLEDAVEKMIGLNEATDAVFEDTAGISEISIGMQKERKDLFKNITDNTKLRDTGDGIDLLVPAHQAVRKYIDNIVKNSCVLSFWI